MMIRQKR